jgi:RNA polymerase sigma-70 factor, ECF subfamily
MVKVRHAELDDQRLIALARDGDADAYDILVQRYQPIAHRTAVVMGGPSDADDVVQDAFIRAYDALHRFRDGAPFRPWLLKIVANGAKNRHRSVRRQLVLADQDARRTALASSSPEDAAAAHDERVRLLRQVNALPERLRDVISCRYLLELSEAETATLLGWPAGTVKSRLARALRELRRGVGVIADD